MGRILNTRTATNPVLLDNPFTLLQLLWPLLQPQLLQLQFHTQLEMMDITPRKLPVVSHSLVNVFTSVKPRDHVKERDMPLQLLIVLLTLSMSVLRYQLRLQDKSRNHTALLFQRLYATKSQKKCATRYQSRSHTPFQ